MNATAIEKLKAAFPEAAFAEVLDSVALTVPTDRLRETLSQLKNNKAINASPIYFVFIKKI